MAKALLGHVGPQPHDAIVAALRGRISALEAEVAALRAQNDSLSALVTFDADLSVRLDEEFSLTVGEAAALR
jgi:hypothetical protein